MRIYTPITFEGLKATLKEAFSLGIPVAVRYPSGKEDTRIRDRFYKDGDYSSLSLKCDFDKSDTIETVIITHGRIVGEAIKASERLSGTGIILLEMLKPYDVIAQNVINALPASVKRIVFLEEEIYSGGMGMNLSNKLRGYLDEHGIAFDIIATDDSFVAHLEKGQHIYSAAGVSSEDICRCIASLK
jgi:deoxyxylulose-5-phosphate synthase